MELLAFFLHKIAMLDRFISTFTQAHALTPRQSKLQPDGDNLGGRQSIYLIYPSGGALARTLSHPRNASIPDDRKLSRHIWFLRLLSILYHVWEEWGGEEAEPMT